MTATILERLTVPDLWTSLLEDLRGDLRRGDPRMPAYEHSVQSGDVRRAAERAVARRHTFAPVRRRLIAKADGRRKRVYILSPTDDLLCRGLQRVLAAEADPWLSDHCHAFRRGRSALTAFRQLLAVPGVEAMHSVHLDIRDYFNSIPVAVLLEGLPAPLRGDGPLMDLLVDLLLRVPVTDAETRGTGVMAGTALAPILANLFLRELDEEIAAAGLVSARYSDDILIVGTGHEVAAGEQLVRRRLAALGLEVNEAKTERGDAGAPWDFLGFRQYRGSIDISGNAARKYRGKRRRLARRLDRVRRHRGLDPVQVSEAYLRRLNRSLYGVDGGDGGFRWASWFLPVLTESQGLAELDHFTQREIRFAATGSHRSRAHRHLDYATLQESGYLPLVSAQAAWRRSPGHLRDLLHRRCLPLD